MQTNSQQAKVATSPTEAVVLKHNQFRIDAVPPGTCCTQVSALDTGVAHLPWAHWISG